MRRCCHKPRNAWSPSSWADKAGPAPEPLAGASLRQCWALGLWPPELGESARLPRQAAQRVALCCSTAPGRCTEGPGGGAGSCPAGWPPRLLSGLFWHLGWWGLQCMGSSGGHGHRAGSAQRDRPKISQSLWTGGRPGGISDSEFQHVPCLEAQASHTTGP